MPPWLVLGKLAFTRRSQCRRVVEDVDHLDAVLRCVIAEDVGDDNPLRDLRSLGKLLFDEGVEPMFCRPSRSSFRRGFR